MTEKRFLYELHKGCFRDNGVEMSIKEVLDTLNELHEENELLKKEYRELEIKLGKLKSEIGELFCENEQLKEELFKARKDYLIETADISDKLYLDEMIEKERREIFGDVE